MTLTLKIRNFKCFNEINIDLEKLTILTGYNGAGKSTVIQTLLILSQTLRLVPNGSQIDLNGSLVHLGNATDVMRQDGTKTMEISLSDGSLSAGWNIKAERRASHLSIDAACFTTDIPAEKLVTNVVAPPNAHRSSKISNNLRDLIFLGAARLTSYTAWPTPSIDVPFADVGKAGEFAPYWHFRLGDDEIAVARRRPNDERSTLRGQVDAYMSDLFPEAQVNTDHLGGVDLYRLDMRFGKGEWVRPGNTGFGLTYAFPLIVALLTADEGQIIIVDSPEAHLHPRAQSELGKIIARLAAAGIRIIVETHSDHFINGVRLAAKESIIQADDATVYFFKGATDTENGVTKLHLNSTGEIDFWPDGFFDQTEIDSARLLGLNVQ